MGTSKWIPKKWIRFTAVASVLFSANLSFADCYLTWNCGGSSQCASLYGGSSGRRGPFASCDGFVKQDNVGSCSCSAGGNMNLPTGSDPAVVLGTAAGNLLWQVITAPAQPKTPEQIEAERQAEILRQQREAERQAKIQKYLNDEASKLQQKNENLDNEAQDSLSLLDRKSSVPVAMSDAELLGSSKGAYAPSLCTKELQELSSNLKSFGDEAQSKGYQFAADDALKTTRQSLHSVNNAAKDAAASKLGMKEYADEYKILKAEIDRVKKDADNLAEIKKCIDTRGCSLIELSKKYDKEFKEWLKSFGTQGLHEAADRVDKASAFYRDYMNRIEQHNEKIINGATKCLAN